MRVKALVDMTNYYGKVPQGTEGTILDRWANHTVYNEHYYIQVQFDNGITMICDENKVS